MLNVIDISNWQKGINIKSLIGVDAVVVKATEGSTYTNPEFKTQIEGAINAGKKIGIYHFATGTNWQAEAAHFIAVAKPYFGKAFLFLDWEADAVKKGEMYAWNWLETVAKAAGYNPGVYMNTSTVNSGNWTYTAKKYPLWVADYGTNTNVYFNSTPKLPAVKYWNGITMHQYSSKGRISGYSGNLDISHFFGDKATWDKLSTPLKKKEGWEKQNDGRWKYVKSNGSYAKSECIKCNTGKGWAAFDKNGYLMRKIETKDGYMIL